MRVHVTCCLRALHAHDPAGREAVEGVERIVLVGVAAHEEPFDDVADRAGSGTEIAEQASLRASSASPPR